MSKKKLSQDAWSQLMATLLTNIDPAQLNPKMVQLAISAPRATGRAIMAFINAGGCMEVGTNSVLNFNTDPHIPDDLSIHPEDQIGSRMTGSWKLGLDKIGLHLDAGQQGGKTIVGHELKKQLEGQRVFPAHVLDYLYEHPQMIPEVWKGKAVFFWGTIYRDSGGNLYIRYIEWNDGGWDYGYNWLGNEWSGRNPSAMMAS